MLKKMSMSFSQKLKKLLVKNPEYGKHLGLHAALQFPSEIILSCLPSYCEPFCDTKLQQRWGGVHRYLDGWFLESHELLDAYQTATRIAAHLTTTSANNYVNVNIYFYNQTGYWHLSVSFGADGKSVSVSTGRALGRREKEDHSAHPQK